MKLIKFITLTTVINIFSVQYINEFQAFVKDFLTLRDDGKIFIDKNIKNVKLDIGLSWLAPMSDYWLARESNLLVFGFEPVPSNIDSIKNKAVYKNANFKLIPCAVGPSFDKIIKFYVTKWDAGCSSMFIPKTFEYYTIEVPIFKLSDFFDIFPFDTHPVIDYIKIDAQGSDLNIAKSAGNYLVNHVVYITLEGHGYQYENNDCEEPQIDSYMNSLGFQRVYSENAQDPTYFNPRFESYIKENTITFYQRG